MLAPTPGYNCQFGKWFSLILMFLDIAYYPPILAYLPPIHRMNQFH
jgi:hypothetical protein